MTEQRRVIAKVMSESKLTFGSKDHPDVDELHKRVSLVDKKISIATVYRTLKLFEESGIMKDMILKRENLGTNHRPMNIMII